MDMNSIYAVKERRPTSIIVFFTAFCCFDNVQHVYPTFAYAAAFNVYFPQCSHE